MLASCQPSMLWIKGNHVDSLECTRVPVDVQAGRNSVLVSVSGWQLAHVSSSNIVQRHRPREKRHGALVKLIIVKIN